MFKKLANMFKKKEEEVEEIIEVIEEEVIEVIATMGEEEIEVEIIEPKPLNPLQQNSLNEEVFEDVKEAKSYDVDTDFRFEVYVGLDKEDNVSLINDKDFSTINEAIWFANNAIKDLFEVGELDRVVSFVHEETKDENGKKVLTRYMVK